MKHKRFDEVFPYTYYFKHKVSGKKYHGVRWGNLSKGITPSDDFAKIYFSSGKLREDFRNNTSDYTYRLCWTFDTVEEAREYENKINSRLMYKDDWEVWNNSKAILNKISPSLGRKVAGTKIAEKISKSNKGKKRSVEVKKTISKTQRKMVEEGVHIWCSEEHAKRSSVRMTKNNPSANGLSEEHKKKIGESQRGIPKPKFTEEHRKNISNALKGKRPWNYGIRGVQKVSEETRKKLSEARKGRTHSEETKKKMSESAHGTKHLTGKKVCCCCCKREWDLGNYAKHIKRVEKT